MAAEVHEGDVLEVLGATPDATYHGCLTDPPYGLSFMGHGWDHGVPSADVWREVLRVMRPGAHLLAFGGTRTFHRLTCAIEDAGFEVRDVAMWMYGSGFPKSHDVSKAIDREAGAVREVVGRGWHHGTGNGAGRTTGKWADTYKPGDAAAGAPITAPATEAARQWAGYGTALKPAYEPILVARKPLEGTVAANVQAHGCGGLAIDACRVGANSGDDYGRSAANASGTVNAHEGFGGKAFKIAERSGDYASPLGRWPANVILDEEAGAALDAQSGERPGMSGGGKHKPGSKGGMFGAIDCTHTARGDTGGASRFFYCPKASRAERDAGLEAFEARSRAEATRRKEGSPGSKNAAAGAGGENCRNIHPTVKPLALARYLARLILPPVEGARLVVPFCGSGSEVIGALQAGWAHVEGIDSWDVAVRIARARIAHHIAGHQMELAHARA